MSKQALLSSWLAQRQVLATELVELSRLVRRSAPRDELSRALAGVCDRLVDYVSAGHFGVYASLVRNGQGRSALARFYPLLRQNTEQALAFNDQAGILRARLSSAAPFDATHLQRSLAQLRVALEDRFTVEDRLLYENRLEQNTLAATA